MYFDEFPNVADTSFVGDLILLHMGLWHIKQLCSVGGWWVLQVDSRGTLCTVRASRHCPSTRACGFAQMTLNQCHGGMREHRRGRGSELAQGRSWTLELSGVASALSLFHLQGAPPALRFPVNRSDGYGANIHRRWENPGAAAERTTDSVELAPATWLLRA